jgi:hypothetical protein
MMSFMSDHSDKKLVLVQTVHTTLLLLQVDIDTHSSKKGCHMSRSMQTGAISLWYPARYCDLCLLNNQASTS